MPETLTRKVLFEKFQPVIRCTSLTEMLQRIRKIAGRFKVERINFQTEFYVHYELEPVYDLETDGRILFSKNPDLTGYDFTYTIHIQ